MIRVEQLTKAYSRNGSPAIQDITFEANDGELVGFVGLNGAGKTTTIRVACGVTLPTKGRVLVDGHDVVRDKPSASNEIGWVPEYPNFEEDFKARELLVYLGGFHQLPGSEIRKRGEDLFQQLNLSGFENQKLKTYSQGMKKRFSLAAALLPDPRNLLLDEVLNGLDPEGIHSVRSLMLDLKKRKKAVLLSSHILTEVENVADRVVVIHKGKIVKIVTKEELSGIESGSRELKITIVNLDEDALKYLEGVGQVKVENGVVSVTKFNAEPYKISHELMKLGFLLQDFRLEKPTLEKYFFQLIGDSFAKRGSNSGGELNNIEST